MQKYSIKKTKSSGFKIVDNTNRFIGFSNIYNGVAGSTINDKFWYLKETINFEELIEGLE